MPCKISFSHAKNVISVENHALYQLENIMNTLENHQL